MLQVGQQGARQILRSAIISSIGADAMAVRFAANHVGEAWRVVSLSERKAVNPKTARIKVD